MNTAKELKGVTLLINNSLKPLLLASEICYSPRSCGGLPIPKDKDKRK